MDHLTGDPLRFSPAGDHIDIPPNHIKQLECAIEPRDTLIVEAETVTRVDGIDIPGPSRSFEKRGVDSFCYSSHDI